MDFTEEFALISEIFSGFTSYPRVLDICAGAGITHFCMQNVEQKFLLPEWGGLVWEPSIPTLSETMKTVQRHPFSCNWGEPLHFHTPIVDLVNQKIYCSTMKHQVREGGCLPARCMQPVQTPLHCQPQWVPLKGEENKKEKESWAAVRKTYISPWLLHGEACSTSFLSLARLQSIPSAPGDKREGEPAHSDMEKAKYSV